MRVGVCYHENEGNSISMSQSVCDVFRRLGHEVTEAVLEKKQFPDRSWNALDFVLILEADHYHRPEKWKFLTIPKVLWYTETAARPDMKFDLRYQQHMSMTPFRFFVGRQDAIKYKGTWLPHGVDAKFFKPLDVPKLYDIGFFGHIYDLRKPMWEKIQKAGYQVSVFPRTPGTYRESFEGLVRLINQCRIILALPAYSHSFTTRPTEAMACGVPLVVPYLADFARCNEAQWIEHGPWLYDEHDILSFNKAVSSALADSPEANHTEIEKYHRLEIRLQKIIDAVQAGYPEGWREEVRCTLREIGAVDIALLRCYRRPEFLHHCLDHMRQAVTKDIQVETWIDYHEELPTDDRLVKMVSPVYPFCIIEQHDHDGDSFLMLEAVKHALDNGAERIYNIEEDVMVAPDFFRWHQAAQKMGYGVTVASYHHTRLGVAEDANPEEVFTDSLPCAVGLCLSRDVASELIQHATPDYYHTRESRRAYIQKHFPNSKLDGSWEWDGLLHRIMEAKGIKALYPLKPRCFHCGFYGQRKQAPGYLNGLGLDQKIARIGKVIYSNDALKEASGNLVACRAFDLREKQWKELRLLS